MRRRRRAADNGPMGRMKAGGLLLAIIACHLLACADGRRVDVYATVPPELALSALRVEVGAAEPGAAPSFERRYAVRRSLEHFVLRLPRDTGKDLYLRVSGEDARGCRQAGALAPPQRLAPEAASAEVTLAPLPAAERGCRVEVQRVGGGSGVVLVDGAPCPPCQGDDAGCLCALEDLNPGSALSLSLQPAEDSAFGGWSGGCAGRGCDVRVSADGPVIARASLLGRQLCSSPAGGGRVCWENPTPFGGDLYAVWAFAPDDVWFVGENGAALRWNGIFFVPIPTGTTATLDAVYGARPDDLWVGGAEGLLRWDGAQLRPFALPAGAGPPITKIHGSGPDEVWMLGAGGTLLRWDGAALRVAPTPVPGASALLVRGPGDVILADAAQRALLRGDGERFVSSALPEGAWQDRARSLSMSGLFADGQELWLALSLGPGGGAAAGGRVLRGPLPSAGVWPAQLALLSSTELSGLAGFPARAGGARPRELWLSGPGLIRNDGARWALERPQRLLFERFTSLAGSGPDDVWFAGLAGSLVRWNGAFFESPQLGPTETLHAVWAGSRDEVWAAGENGRMLRRIGGNWWPVDTKFRGTWRGLWGTGTGAALQLWAVSEFGTVLRRVNGAFDPPVEHDAGPALLTAVAGSGPDDVYIAGKGGVALRWNGQAIERLPELPAARRGLALNAVWVADRGRALFGGEGGTLLRLQGGAWFDESLPEGTPDIVALSGVVRPDGGLHVAFSLAAVGDARSTLGCWTAAVGESFAVRPGTPIVRIVDRGGARSETPIPGSAGEWLSVTGVGKHDLWAVGSGGGILHVERP